MASPLADWDLERYRKILRERASRLKRDTRVRVRFDDSDLANETLFKAIQAKNVPQGMTDEEKLHWLAAIQNSALIDLLRKQYSAKGGDVRRERNLQDALNDSSIDQAQLAVDSSASPSERAEQRETEQRTLEAIDKLDSPKREILRLRRQGRSFEEIAEELGLSLGVVAGQYYRGLKKLKEILGPEGQP